MRILTLLALVLGTAAVGRPEDTSALINEALDKNITLQLDGMLPDVLKTIDAKTGVHIEPSRSVYTLLPWGEQTRVKATVENQTLRQALTAISQKLGLTWSLGQFEVELKPMPALARLGRRATVAELQALDVLHSTPYSPPANGAHTVQAVVDSVDQKLASVKQPGLAVELRAGEGANPQEGAINLEQNVNIPRNATLAAALEELTRQTNATWYPWGKSVVIVPKQEQIRLQLGKTITARFNGADILDVLNTLSERTGVPLSIEPGAIQRVPPEYRTVRSQLENATVRQVLDNIRGLTGLDYVVKPDGIYIWNQNPNASRGGANDPAVGIIELDGGLQLFLRESQVPTDLRDYLNHKQQEAIQRLRRRMKDEGFTPATQPTTQTAQKEKDL